MLLAAPGSIHPGFFILAVSRTCPPSGPRSSVSGPELAEHEPAASASIAVGRSSDRGRMNKGVMGPRSAPKVKVSKLDYAKIQRTKTQSQKSATGTAKNS